MSTPALANWSEHTAGGVRWWVAPGLRDQLLGPDGLRIDEWIKDGRATVVKQGPHRVVWRVKLPDGQVVYVKQNLLPDFRAWLRQMVRPSKARMELERCAAVAERGVPTVEPLALGERQTILGACDSFLVTRGLDDTQPLNTFLAGTLPAMPAKRLSRVRQRLAVALGRFVARLHEAGIRHDDLHAANILVELNADEQPRLHLIDLNSAQLGPSMDWPASRDNLVILTRWFIPRVSRADRLRFWRAYYETRGYGVWPRGCQGHREHFARARELEREALESTLSFWRNRDARCFRSNRYYRRIGNSKFAGHAAADVDASLLEKLLADPEAPFRDGGGRVLKHSRGSTVIEIEWEFGGVKRRLIFKRFRAPRWADSWASLLRPAPALRAWKFGHGLRERCLPTARPLVVLYRLQAGMLRECYLLTEKIENVVDLHGFVVHLRQLPAHESRRGLRMAIDDVARAVRHLHRCRLSHRDLKANNLLIAPDLERQLSSLAPIDAVTQNPVVPNLLPLPASAVWFIDLAGVRLHARLSRSRRLQNLARLNASFHQSTALTRTDKLRFLRCYMLWNLIGSGGWKSWWRAIDQATQRKAARNGRRGRILA